MKKFIKDNIVLTLGISLPFVLVVFFMLASALPKYLVENPQYDFFFSEETFSHERYGQRSYVEFQVQEQKLYMKVDPVRYQSEKSLPRLYRYVAATGKVEEISFQAPDMSRYQALEGNVSANIVINVDPTKLPSQEQAQDTSKIVSEMGKVNNNPHFMLPVTETAEVNINALPVAPDGYQFFNEGSRYRSRDLGFWGIGSSYNNHDPLLSKSGKNILIPHTRSQAQYPYYSSLNFIGWVVP